jgi:Uma2 family endonuclease
MAPAAAKVEPQKAKMTYEEFLDWCDEDTLAEWVDGEIVITSPASRVHQDLAGFLAAVLRAYVEERGIGQIFIPPFQMKTGPDLPGREPDLLFMTKKTLKRLKQTYLDGPADLVVEIVSPDSRLRDRGEKLAEYEAGGVREYWVLDPTDRRGDFYVRAADGRYERKRSDDQGIYHSQVIDGLWLRERWFWKNPLPKVLSILRELGVV